MKKIFSTLFFLSLFFTASSQTFIGTMTVGSYTRKNVETKLTVKNNKASLVLYNVKFSRFMPVTIDVTIPNLDVNKQNKKTIVKGNNIIPTSKGKNYEKFKITNFSGNVADGKFAFSTLMGDKKVSYSGKQKKVIE